MICHTEPAGRHGPVDRFMRVFCYEACRTAMRPVYVLSGKPIISLQFWISVVYLG